MLKNKVKMAKAYPLELGRVIIYIKKNSKKIFKKNKIPYKHL